jgi:type 1 glutamine amidotransferase
MKVLPLSILSAATWAAMGLMEFACASSGSGNSSLPSTAAESGAQSTSGGGSGATPAPSGGGGGAMPGPSGGGDMPAPSGGTDGGPIEGGGGAADTQADAAPPASDGPADDAPPNGQAKPSRALLYTFSVGHLLHPSIGPATMALRDALMPLGFVVDISVDPTMFTATGLQNYTVVVLISSSGLPFGTPGTVPMNALASFVRAGGGLVGIHSASLVDYAANSTFVALLGGKFSGHPGALRNSTCQSEGTHPAVVDLPKPYVTNDEFYTFVAMNPDDQIDLRCAGVAAGDVLPIAWHRTEGNGRVFYTGLGHGPELWGTTTTFVKAHVLPAILWAAGR